VLCVDLVRIVQGSTIGMSIIAAKMVELHESRAVKNAIYRKMKDERFVVKELRAPYHKSRWFVRPEVLKELNMEDLPLPDPPAAKEVPKVASDAIPAAAGAGTAVKLQAASTVVAAKKKTTQEKKEAAAPAKKSAKRRIAPQKVEPQEAGPGPAPETTPSPAKKAKVAAASAAKAAEHEDADCVIIIDDVENSESPTANESEEVSPAGNVEASPPPTVTTAGPKSKKATAPTKAQKATIPSKAKKATAPSKVKKATSPSKAKKASLSEAKTATSPSKAEKAVSPSKAKKAVSPSKAKKAHASPKGGSGQGGCVCSETSPFVPHAALDFNSSPSRRPFHHSIFCQAQAGRPGVKNAISTKRRPILTF
jgi:hypothetical protein